MFVKVNTLSLLVSTEVIGVENKLMFHMLAFSSCELREPKLLLMSLLRSLFLFIFLPPDLTCIDWTLYAFACLFVRARQQITNLTKWLQRTIRATSAIRVSGSVVKFAPELKRASKFNAILASNVHKDNDCYLYSIIRNEHSTSPKENETSFALKSDKTL